MIGDPLDSGLAAPADGGRESRSREWQSNAQLKAAGLKRCVGCKEVKTRAEFSPNGVSPKGVIYVAKLCRPCNAANERLKRKANPRPKTPTRNDIPPGEMTPRELRSAGLKRCSLCQEIKSREDFYANKADGSLRGRCKACETANQRARRKSDPEKHRLRDRQPERLERKRARRRAHVEMIKKNKCECGCGGDTQRRFVRGHHTRMPAAEPPRQAQPLELRLRASSELTEDGHWLWKMSRDRDGYGSMKVQGRTLRAARVSHEVFIGPIPDGYYVHQICRSRDCVAPEHLEAITPAESIRRGDSDPLKNFASYYQRRRAATHCSNGHPWDEKNTRQDDVQRFCRACLREAARERRDDPAFRAAERVRERELYGENRDHILARKRAWYDENSEHIREKSGAKRRAAYALAKAEGRCAFGSGYGCVEPARPGRVMCADHQKVQNERNWVHTNESIWESYFERGLTGDQCWICTGTITADDPLNHDHLVPRSRGGPNEVWNFAPAHQSCNVRRQNLPLAATLLAYPGYLREALLEIPEGILD